MKSKKSFVVKKIDPFKLGKSLYYSWRLAEFHAHRLVTMIGIDHIDQLELKRGFITARVERQKRLGINEDGESIDCFYGAMQEIYSIS